MIANATGMGQRIRLPRGCSHVASRVVAERLPETTSGALVCALTLVISSFTRSAAAEKQDARRCCVVLSEHSAKFHHIQALGQKPPGAILQ
jgi:hypothetical protein